MGANLTIQDFFRLILFFLGMGIGTYIILLLIKINKIVDQFKNIIEANTEELDITIKQLPDISRSINKITEETSITLERAAPDIGNLIHNASEITSNINSITSSVDHVTLKAQSTFDSVTNNLVSTAETFNHSSKTFSDYFSLAKSILEAIKGLLSNL